MASNADNSQISPSSFIKLHFVDSCNLKTVPSKFKFINDPRGSKPDALPVIDFSALAGGDPDQRSEAIHDLAKACEEWSFFILVNNGIPEALMNATLTALREFVNLPEDEKEQYKVKSASNPIIYGTADSRDTSNGTFFTLWRENLKLHVHPDFHCPDKPHFLREVVLEYSERIRKLARKLVEAVSETLKLEQHYVDEVLGLESSFQRFVANYYPPSPQPDQAIGVPPHTDLGLLTILINNGVAGLQIDHDGKWLEIDSRRILYWLMLLTSLRYKAVKHRVVVNEESERLSIVSVYGPSKSAIVGPAAPLVEKDGGAMYPSVNYEEHVEQLLSKSRRNANLS